MIYDGLPFVKDNSTSKPSEHEIDCLTDGLKSCILIGDSKHSESCMK